MADIKIQFDPILRNLIKSKKRIAVIPIGSIEQHGPHLPISTDSEIVSKVAEKLSDKNGVPYQNLINLYLKDCASSHKELEMNWK